jgi:phage N-6-adenine-methyltransferase
VTTGAAFARGASKQDYATPKELIGAVTRRFGLIDFDLAATGDNAVASRFFGPATDHYRKCEGVDSLAQDWNRLQGRLWLNPPFDRIEPWAAKCAACDIDGTSIFFLVPASVGSEWFAKYVDGKARVYFLRPRLSFDGKNPYPKDCLLAVYSDSDPGYECWRWRP